MFELSFILFFFLGLNHSSQFGIKVYSRFVGLSAIKFLLSGHPLFICTFQMCSYGREGCAMDELGQNSNSNMVCEPTNSGHSPFLYAHQTQ